MNMKWIKITAVITAILFTHNSIASYAGPEVISNYRSLNNLQPKLMTWHVTDEALATTAIAHYYNVLGGKRMRCSALHLYPLVNGKRVDLFIHPDRVRGDLITVPCEVGGKDIYAKLNLQNGDISIIDDKGINNITQYSESDERVIKEPAEDTSDVKPVKQQDSDTGKSEAIGDNPPSASWNPKNPEWTANAWFFETVIPILAGLVVKYGLINIFGIFDIPDSIVSGLTALIFWMPHLRYVGIRGALNPRILLLTAMTYMASSQWLGFSGDYPVFISWNIALMLTHYFVNISSMPRLNINWTEEEEKIWEDDPILGKRLDYDKKFEPKTFRSYIELDYDSMPTYYDEDEGRYRIAWDKIKTLPLTERRGYREAKYFMMTRTDFSHTVATLPKKVQKALLLSLVENISDQNDLAEASLCSLLCLGEPGFIEVRRLLNDPDKKIGRFVVEYLSPEEQFYHDLWIYPFLEKPEKTIRALMRFISMEEISVETERIDAMGLLSQYIEKALPGITWYYDWQRIKEGEKEKARELLKIYQELMAFAADEKRTRPIYFALAKTNISLIFDEFYKNIRLHGRVREPLISIMGALCKNGSSFRYIKKSKLFTSRLIEIALDKRNGALARSYALELIATGGSMEGFLAIADVAAREKDLAIRSFARMLISKNINNYIKIRKKAKRNIVTFGTIGRFVVLPIALPAGAGYLAALIKHYPFILLAFIPVIVILSIILERKNKRFPSNDNSSADKTSAQNNESVLSRHVGEGNEVNLPVYHGKGTEDKTGAEPSIAILTDDDRRNGVGLLIEYVSRMLDDPGVDYSGRTEREREEREERDNADYFEEKVQEYLASAPVRGSGTVLGRGTSISELLPELPEALDKKEIDEMAKLAAAYLNSLCSSDSAGSGRPLSKPEIAAVQRKLAEAMFSGFNFSAVEKKLSLREKAYRKKSGYPKEKEKPYFYGLIPGADTNLWFKPRQTAGSVTFAVDSGKPRTYELMISYLPGGKMHILEMRNADLEEQVMARMIYEYRDIAVSGRVLTIKDTYCSDAAAAYDLRRFVAFMVDQARNPDRDFHLNAYNRIFQYNKTIEERETECAPGVPAGLYHLKIEKNAPVPVECSMYPRAVVSLSVSDFTQDAPYFTEDTSRPVTVSHLAQLLKAEPVERQDSVVNIKDAQGNVEYEALVEYKALFGRTGIPVYIVEAVTKGEENVLPWKGVAFTTNEGVFILKKKILEKIERLIQRVEKIGSHPVTLEQLILSRIYPVSRFQDASARDREIMKDVVRMIFMHELQHYLSDRIADETSQDPDDRVKDEEASYLAPIVFGRDLMAQLYLLAETEVEDIELPHLKALENIWDAQQDIFHSPLEKQYMREHDDKKYPEALRMVAVCCEEFMKHTFTKYYLDIPHAANREAMQTAQKDINSLIPSRKEKIDVFDKESPLMDTGVLRNISSSEELAQCLKELTLSCAFDKKLVLAFDTDTTVCQIGNPMRKVIEALERLKKKEDYKRLLANLVIVPGKAEAFPTILGEYLEDKDARVFVFAGDNDKTKKTLSSIESLINTVYIDDKDFEFSAYYPLAEIVVLSIAQYLEGIVEEGKLVNVLEFGGTDFNLASINIEFIKSNGNSLIFRLLPSADELATGELMNKYAMLERFLEAA